MSGAASLTRSKSQKAKRKQSPPSASDTNPDLTRALPNITRTWLAHRQSLGETRADALRWLAAQGCAASNSRLNEWLRGARYPNRTTRIVMMRDMLPAEMERLSNMDLTPDVYDDLSEAWT
jgi:hypothetical protein